VVLRPRNSRPPAARTIPAQRIAPRACPLAARAWR